MVCDDRVHRGVGQDPHGSGRDGGSLRGYGPFRLRRLGRAPGQVARRQGRRPRAGEPAGHRRPPTQR